MKDNTVETFWETAARTKMGTYLTNIETSFFQGAMYFPSYKMVCDVGAGAGKFSLLAAQNNVEVVALDIDLNGLKRLKAKDPRIDAIQADARALPLKNSSVDAAFSVEVVDYIPELGKVVEECNRILKNGSPFMFSFGNQSSIKSKARQLGGKNYLHSYKEAVRELRASGFAIVKKTGFNWLPFNRTSENSLIPFLGKAERLLGLRRLPRWSPWVLVKALKSP